MCAFLEKFPKVRGALNLEVSKAAIHKQTQGHFEEDKAEKLEEKWNRESMQFLSRWKSVKSPDVCFIGSTEKQHKNVRRYQNLISGKIN